MNPNPDELAAKLDTEFHEVGARYLNCNGGEYLCGWTKNHKWFTITAITTVYEDGEWYVETLGEYPHTGVDQDNIVALLQSLVAGL